ncbi:MAG: hypothetical protein AB1510_07775 [Bacillota bacterium]
MVTIKTWWRGSEGAQFVELDGHRCIEPVGGQVFYTIPPLSDTGEFFTPGGYTKSKDVFTNPTEALANIRDEKTALLFAKKFGPLGLWEHPELGAGKFRFWPGGEGRGTPGFYCPKEPIALIFIAAAEFRDTLTSLKEGEGEATLNRYVAKAKPGIIWNGEGWCEAWSCPSLLVACYLLLWRSLVEGDEWRVCEHHRCRQLFRRGPQPNRAYCSRQCQINAKRARQYQEQKKHRSSD